MPESEGVIEQPLKERKLTRREFLKLLGTGLAAATLADFGFGPKIVTAGEKKEDLLLLPDNVVMVDIGTESERSYFLNSLLYKFL